MSRDMLRRIPRLLDVPVGKRRWDPRVVEMLGMVRKSLEKQAADGGTKKGTNNDS